MNRENLMKKSCNCGGVMTIHMHTLIYSTRVKINHVPVYTCQECARYEPLPCIKRDLGKLIGELEESWTRRSVSFAERNEWASVLKETFSGFIAGGIPEFDEAIRRSIQGRIDLLLDVYRFAGDCADQKWMEDTGLRLSQLTYQSAESAK